MLWGHGPLRSGSSLLSSLQARPFLHEQGLQNRPGIVGRYLSPSMAIRPLNIGLPYVFCMIFSREGEWFPKRWVPQLSSISSAVWALCSCSRSLRTARFVSSGSEEDINDQSF